MLCGSKEFLYCSVPLLKSLKSTWMFHVLFHQKFFLRVGTTLGSVDGIDSIKRHWFGKWHDCFSTYKVDGAKGLELFFSLWTAVCGQLCDLESFQDAHVSPLLVKTFNFLQNFYTKMSWAAFPAAVLKTFCIILIKPKILDKEMLSPRFTYSGFTFKNSERYQQNPTSICKEIPVHNQ